MNPDLTGLAKYIEELVKAQPDKHVLKVNGQEYFIRHETPLDLEHELKKAAVVNPEPISALTLESAARMLEAYGNDDDEGFFAHVVSANMVTVQAVSTRADGSRDALIQCAHRPFEHRFGKWLKLGDFVEWILAGFAVDETSMRLVELLKKGASIERSRKHFEQSGGQHVVDSEAVSVAAWVDEVDDRFKLRPHVTFPEVEQPELPCALRFKQEGKEVYAKLLTADGGAWRVKAIESVGAWLETRFANLKPAVPVIR